MSLARLRSLRRLPSPAMVVALLALFVALGGPATAARLIDGGSIRKGSITGAQVRDHSLRTADLSAGTVRRLERTPPGSVGAVQLLPGAVGTSAIADKGIGTNDLADGAVTGLQMAADAVTASKIADGAVGAAAVADGSLQTRDVGDFYGAVQVDFMTVPGIDVHAAAPNGDNCKVGEPFAPQATMPDAAPSIADDVIVVTPPVGWPDQLLVSGYPGAGNTLRIVVCNPTTMPISVPAGITPVFQYLGIDQP